MFQNDDGHHYHPVTVLDTDDMWWWWCLGKSYGANDDEQPGAVRLFI